MLSFISTFDVEGVGISGATLEHFFASGVAAELMTSPPERAKEATQLHGGAKHWLVRPNEVFRLRRLVRQSRIL